MPSLLELEKKRFWFFNRKRQQGTALLLALILGGFIVSVGLIIAKTQLNEIKFSVKENFSSKALIAADAGIERALYKIYQEDPGTLPDTCTPSSCSLCSDTVNCKYIDNQTLDNGAVYYVIVPRGNDNPVLVGTSTEYIIIRSIGSFHQTERSLEVNLYKKIPTP